MYKEDELKFFCFLYIFSNEEEEGKGTEVYKTREGTFILKHLLLRSNHEAICFLGRGGEKYVSLIA